VICGLEECKAWNRIFLAPDDDVDLEAIEREVLGTALQALERHPNIRAFVLECTDLPPFSGAIRRHTGLPVFDFITMVNYLHSAI
jgi:acetyl-CoA acetyltransferase